MGVGRALGGDGNRAGHAAGCGPFGDGGDPRGGAAAHDVDETTRPGRDRRDVERGGVSRPGAGGQGEDVDAARAPADEAAAVGERRQDVAGGGDGDARGEPAEPAGAAELRDPDQRARRPVQPLHVARAVVGHPHRPVRTHGDVAQFLDVGRREDVERAVGAHVGEGAHRGEPDGVVGVDGEAVRRPEPGTRRGRALDGGGVARTGDDAQRSAADGEEVSAPVGDVGRRPVHGHVVGLHEGRGRRGTGGGSP